VYIRLFIPVLEQTLKRLGELSARKVSQVGELLKDHADVLLDGTERPTQKPSDAYKEQRSVIVVRKTHNLKN
jgi:hypothetical protein